MVPINLLPAGAPMMTQNALGVAMRDPAPAQPAATDQANKPRPKWYDVVGTIGDTLAMMGGRNPLYSTFTQQDAERARKAREEEEMLMQRNALAQALANNDRTKGFADLARRGVSAGDISKLIDASAPTGFSGPETIQLMNIAADPNQPIALREAAQAQLNNRAAAGLIEGSPATGFNLSSAFQPINLISQGVPPPAAPQQAPAAQPQQAQRQQQAPMEVMRATDFVSNAQAMGPEAAVNLLRRTGIRVQISSDAEWNALPPGTPYLDPQGKPRTKR